MRRFGKRPRLAFKGEINLVTEADRRSEDLIVRTIRRKFPDHEILTEEEKRPLGASNCRWIIDPLDGTTNYTHGFPVFCVSIAFETEGKVVLGVVCNPVLEEIFVAERGRGSTLNRKRISVSREKMLTNSLLATGFPYDIRESTNNNLDHFNRFAVRARAIRRAGSAALDLAYTAMGRFDGFWELKLAPWDVAAGALLVQEAGGRVTDFRGGQFVPDGRETLASNGRIHAQMMRVLGTYLTY
jgi:myo-inositol-1(or 4)-monophosphatase